MRMTKGKGEGAVIGFRFLIDGAGAPVGSARG
jgi:hypothetical protein